MQWHWTLNTVTNECSILCNILMSQFVCRISRLLISIISLISGIKKCRAGLREIKRFTGQVHDVCQTNVPDSGAP